eukprot:CAMPEP_0117027312 /NCGR_PEP_ID=MMETSP0472-20121206/19977_1 /TAXON_ID=693140 ORGANISM="Tiarina fusus, Strain LIS" /NCGR_SAMPLE_ID=MMETSP0472 /ASSEMBLY_ACC=CAM_ASM_000603 /LENGTH=114 /DNA_ID=CAMNT_0004734525 /DNA_START=237 /DNA_END=584 /DNA_ORIENTATION=-
MAAASLRNDLSRVYGSVRSEMAVYLAALEGIEKDTGIPFAYMQNMASTFCWNGSPTVESDEDASQIEVEFVGSKNRIKPSDSEDIYEVAQKRERFKALNFLRARSRSRSFRSSN